MISLVGVEKCSADVDVPWITCLVGRLKHTRPHVAKNAVRVVKLFFRVFVYILVSHILIYSFDTTPSPPRLPLFPRAGSPWKLTETAGTDPLLRTVTAQLHTGGREVGSQTVPRGEGVSAGAQGGHEVGGHRAVLGIRPGPGFGAILAPQRRRGRQQQNAWCVVFFSFCGGRGGGVGCRGRWSDGGRGSTRFWIGGGTGGAGWGVGSGGGGGGGGCC